MDNNTLDQLQALCEQLGIPLPPAPPPQEQPEPEPGLHLPQASTTPKITRHWAMPNRETFSIKPIAELLRRYTHDTDVVVDPFARNAPATWTNDLNPDTSAQYHMHAEKFCEMLAEKGVVADVVRFDPPYSSRQIKECYDGIGLRLSQREAQVMFTAVKDVLSRLLRLGGIAISCGWNSTGFGKKRGYERLETRIVCHGSQHHDTIVVVERKTVVAQTGSNAGVSTGK
jgi:hypothetical protein